MTFLSTYKTFNYKHDSILLKRIPIYIIFVTFHDNWPVQFHPPTCFEDCNCSVDDAVVVSIFLIRLERLVFLPGSFDKHLRCKCLQ